MNAFDQSSSSCYERWNAFATPVTTVGDVNVRLDRQDDSDANTLRELLSSCDPKHFVKKTRHNIKGLVLTSLETNGRLLELKWNVSNNREEAASRL